MRGFTLTPMGRLKKIKHCRGCGQTRKMRVYDDICARCKRRESEDFAEREAQRINKKYNESRAIDSEL